MTQPPADGADTTRPAGSSPVASTDVPLHAAIRGGLAAMLAGAGAIHLSVVPTHAEAWLPYAIGFAVVGWTQLALGAAVLWRPTRGALAAVIILNIAVLAGWAVSRTAGWPIGPDAGQAEAANILDLTATAFQTGAVLIASLAMAGINLASTSNGRRSRWIVVGLPAALILFATSAALASPEGQHVHGDHSGDEGAAAHGHSDEGGAHAHGDADPSTPVSLDDRILLGEQLTAVRAVALAYPTVADAEAAGFYRAGPFAPGAGAHYVNPNGSWSGDDGFRIDDPMTLLFGGTEPTSPVVGVMYYTVADEAPEGFAGPLDVWHNHTGICLTASPTGGVDVPIPPDEDATKEACDAFGGQFMDVSGWMVHAWVVPGWDSPAGVFSHDNPQIICADGRAEIDELFRGCDGVAT